MIAENTAGPAKRRRRRILALLQWGITIGSLALLLRVVNPRSIGPALRAADGRLLALAVLVALLHFGVAAWRWQKTILLATGRTVPLPGLFRSYIASFFVGSALPGSISGDIVRVYDLSRAIGGSSAALLTILMERLLGLAVVLLLGAVAWFTLPARPSLSPGPLPWRLAVPALIAGAALASLGRLSWRLKPAWWTAALRWLDSLLVVAARIPAMAASRPWSAFVVILATIAYQTCSLLIVYLCLLAAGAAVPPLLFLTVGATGALLLMLPVSVQGIGVRESLYLALLLPRGIPGASILAGLALTYIVGLPFIAWGWYLFTRRARGTVASYEGL